MSPMGKSSCRLTNIRASALYDIENNIVVDLQFGPKIFSEEELLLRHTEVMNIDDLIVTDRGYHSIWFLMMLCVLNRKFVCRARTGDKYVKRFLESGKTEDTIELSAQASNLNSTLRHNRKIREAGLKAGDSTKVRLIRYEQHNANGEVVVYAMITNLLDKKKYPASEFKDLYRKRWKVEEFYKTYKISIEVERWTGCTWVAAQQDILASVLLHNLTRMLSNDIDRQIIAESTREVKLKKRKYVQKLNITEVLRVMRTLLTEYMSGRFNGKSQAWIRQFRNLAYLYRTDIKPGRNCCRKRKNSNKRFHMNCKVNA